MENPAAIYYLRLDFFLCERLLAFFFGERLAFFALVFFLAAISVAPRTTSTACGQKSGKSLGCSGSGQSARNATSVYGSKRNFNPCLTLEQELQKRVNTSLAIQAAIDHRVAGFEPLAKRLGVEPAREYDCRFFPSDCTPLVDRKLNLAR
jgi:hypothetical protein